MGINITAYSTVMRHPRDTPAPDGVWLKTSDSAHDYLLAPARDFGLAEQTCAYEALSAYFRALTTDFGDAFAAFPYFFGDSVIEHDRVTTLHDAYAQNPVLTGEHGHPEHLAFMHTVIGKIIAAAAAHPNGGVVLS